MKAKLFTLLLAVAASIGTMFAEKVHIGGLYYNLDATNQTAEVTSQNSDYPYWSTTITTANIPDSATYNSVTYSVTSIGNEAFYGCGRLTSITIPNSVTSIGRGAFSVCSGLTSVTIGNNVTSIGDLAFSGCSGLTSVTIPGSVTSIGYGAFSFCSGLTKVNITDIAAWCNIQFENNDSNPLYYAKQLYNINDTEVTNLTIPNSVTSIGQYTFSGCSGLTSVTIPNSVTSIGSCAFYNCTGLTSVTIPNSVTSIGGRAFGGCSGLTSLSVEAGNTVYDSRNNCNAIIETSSNTLIFGCQNTTIPNSVTSIGDYAFSGCSGLTSVTIPNSVTSIGRSAFEGCSGLTSPLYNAHVFAYMPTSYSGAYTIPDGIESIAGGAFSYCRGLTSVTIPNSVTSIGSSAFSGCSGLTSVTIPNSVISIGSGAFHGCSGLTSLTIPNSVTSIESYAFNGCSGLTSVTIPNSVISIGDHAFYNCIGLTSVTIPNSVTSIGEEAFWGCSGLTKVNITDIAAWCNIQFENNSLSNPLYYAKHLYINDTEVTNLTIPNSVTSIGQYTFSGCSSLTSVTIPNSVISIGYRAFLDCTGLTSPIYNAHVFAYLPTSYSGAYTIPDGIKSIAGGAFESCSGLTSVTIPNSVTSIGYFAFYKCSGLTSPLYNAHVFAYMPTSYSSAYTIPDGIESIAGGAFYNCSGLTSVTIPHSVTSIGEWAFSYCYGLTSVTIPNSVTSIGNSAFYKCSGLTSVTIPNSVTSIGEYAFSYCSSLTSVTIEAETPPALGSSVFNNTSNCPIYVPCTIDAYTSAWPEYANRIIIMPLNYQITGNVNIEGAGSVQLPQYICDSVIIAVSNYGYHFTKWSDGNTDNPRTIVLTQDTTFTAEFAYDRVGTCGKDLALVWSYDPTNKVLTIGNAGSFTENMQFGLEAPNEMEELVIGNFVTAIGANAFAGISSLKKVSIGESVKTIGEQAFFNCVNLETIFNYRPTPTNAYSNAFDGVDKFECKLYVLTGSIDMYKNAYVWRDFYYTYAIGAEEATVTTNDVTVEPQDNAATVTWPTSENAASYTIQITKDGVVFCTLIFNGNGQLTGIAFAPSRDGQAHAPQAIMTANGMQFTVTGLDRGTHYALTLQAKDNQETVLASYSSEFTTTGQNTPQSLEDVSFSTQGGDRGRLILRNGRILILRGDKTYTPTGQEVK